MKPVNAKRQRGAALLAMLAVIMLGASWYLVSGLNAGSGAAVAARKASNAAVLNRAKLALIGYVAAQAAKAGERNPGRLPCPEHAWYVGNADKEGVMGPSVGVSNPGTGTQDCSSIGRLPWRTLGLEKLVDASGEPLWYVVGPAWRLTTSTTSLLINSNTPSGDISVDGQQMVALIVAPGAAMNVQTSTNCAARNQSRSTPSPTMNAADYIECFNSGSLQFFTTASSTSFNDQVVRISLAEIMPVIEGAIASRIEREIVPALNSVYTPATWGFSGSNPVLPLAAPFANPGTSNYQGAASTCVLNVCKGLLPFFQTVGCTPAADPRCTTSGGLPFFVFSKSGNDVQTAGSGSIQTQSTCSWTSTVYTCTGEYLQPSISVTVKINVANVAMGLRALDLSKVTCTAVDDAGGGDPVKTVACTASVALQTDGSATFTVATSALPDIVGSGWGPYANYKISIDRAAVGDHALLSSTDSTTGWFVRNEWYRLVYYAVAQGHTAGTLPPACATGTTCLPPITNVAPTGAQRAILILSGRSLNGLSRPSATLADYLESGNATGAFERKTVTAPAATSYPDTGSANAYVVSVTSIKAGSSLQFRVTNANTGASTLTTTATGAKNLVNLDGSNLAASTIRANADVRVVYDGTRFLLSSPFNDRIVVVSSNP